MRSNGALRGIVPWSRVGAGRRRRLRHAALVLVCQVALVTVLLSLWEWSTASDALKFLFGSPSAIWGFLVKMWGDGSLFRDTYVTGIETLLGFVLGNLIGTLCGLGLWYSRFLSLVMQPFVIAIGAIPIIGEFMSSSEGLGHAIFRAGSLYIIPKVFAALVATIVLALVLSYLVGKLERALLPWRQDL